ncbi:MAG: RDD family protein [Bowdeniella nasicola]|nr:RDD family protein [Bowdeniella nasicola]
MSNVVPRPRRDTTDFIVTGDAVVLEVQPATFWMRAVGTLIDIVVYVGIAVTVSILLSEWLNSLNRAQSATVWILMLVTTVLFVPMLVELMTGGRSLGKLFTGIRVIRLDGGPVRLRHVFVRHLLGIVEVWATFGTLAAIITLTNIRAQRLGDILAGTYCVRMRQFEENYQPLIMPPELVPWVSTADISAIPSPLTIRCRTFLQRARTMAPAARHHYGTTLANELSAYVRPFPPAGTHPERFIAAVLVRRRNEEYLAAIRSLDNASPVRQ